MRRRALLTTLLAASALACSTLQVSTDYDPATDFGRYRTFAFKEGAKARSSLAQERIVASLEAAMTARGLAKSSSGQDLNVFTHFVLGREVQLNTYGYGMGGWYGYRWGGGMQTTQVQEIPTGTLVVDLVDAKANKLVWRGTAKDQISSSSTPEERQAKANEVARRLFESYPPKK